MPKLSTSPTNTKQVFSITPVMPVVAIEKLEHAVPLAQALVNGGIHGIEVTLRTPCALEAIGLIADQVPDMHVGAGTVLNQHQLHQAIAAGSQFIFSPGATTALLKEAKVCDIPFVPAIATASEIMTALEYDFNYLKFFPAEANGGIKALSALTAPFASVHFCPTGGITADSCINYLQLASVDCVGGSWLVPKRLDSTDDFTAITLTAQNTLKHIQDNR